MKRYLISALLGLFIAIDAQAQMAAPDQHAMKNGQACYTNKANTLKQALTGTTATWSGVDTALTFTSTQTTGTAPFSVASTTNVANLNCSTLTGSATGTSGATIPLLNGNNTYSGTSLFTSTSVPTLANGNAAVAASSTKGGVFTGQGSVDDLDFQNKSGADICIAATGTTTLNCTGLQVGGTAVLTANQSISLTSDVTGSGATSIATTIAANAVTNAKAAQMTANTMKGNWTSSTANASDNAMPSCSDSGGNHLNYVSGTGITCGTSDSHVGTVTSITAGTGLTGGAITTTGTIAEDGYTLTVKTITGMNIGGL